MDKINLFLIAHAEEPGTGTVTGRTATLPNDSSLPLGPQLAQYFQWLIYAAIILAVLMIAYGGIEYIVSMVPGKKEEGKKRIWNAIYGLILAFAAYMILKTI